ncbi:glycerate kinase [Arthrobacter sp. 24S4-2]|uniref:glycerate kinase n=1 Tax=Arthrobacter sp. 24S4-2 TaxID=2575374 RepID=UPI0010C79DEA|nr:glycerate kinase [Arthrobacter sp. 24S4-2]QCO98033.1 glycerate kinase [Arthrobacter sp. 24S4-2]
MHILIAPDSFKGTFTASRVASLIAGGAHAYGADVTELPVADGGEGTCEILSSSLGAEEVWVETFGPWREPLRACYGLAPNGTAVVGLAAASGITAPCTGERNALTADTYGTGVLMAHAARSGARRILVAAGGSATTDGGSGAITAIEEHGGLRGATVTVLSDVTTVFENAARVFGPQKGASPTEVDQLTARLHAHASDYPRDPRGVPRTGAAGGFSGGMWSMYGATLVPGAEFVLNLVDFDRSAANADAIVVGEGRLDSQTGQGKIISEILARSTGKPVYAVVGSVDPDLGDYANNFAGVVVASDTAALQHAGHQIASLVGADRAAS